MQSNTQMDAAMSTHEENINIKADKKICLALMMSFIVLTLQYVVLIAFNLIDTDIGSSIQLTSKVFVGAAFLYAFPSVFRRNGIKMIAAYSITIAVFFMQYLMFTENREYLLDLLFPFFFICLPAFIYAASIRSLSILKEQMRKTSFVILMLGILLGILILIGKANIGTYSMSLSYYMLMPAIVFTDELISKFSIKVLMHTMLSILIILAFGARGPLFCILGFLFLRFLRNVFKITYRKAILYFGICVAIPLLFFNRNIILSVIDNLLMSVGIQSRSIQLLSQDEIALSGREFIYDTILNQIRDNPIHGIGIAGDRRIIGGYAHNFFLEVLSQFGLILGGILAITVLSLIIRALIVKNKNYVDMISIWVALGFIHLMVSSSYLIDIKFWILVGLLINKALFRYDYLSPERTSIPEEYIREVTYT